MNKDTIKTIGGWIVGLFFLFASMGAFVEEFYGTGVLWLIVPLISIPQVYHNVFRDFGMTVRVLLVIALWILGSLIYTV